MDANLATLRQAGIRLALDDFGTGYSSLVLLKRLRPDMVKIDKSFIQAVLEDKDNLHIIMLISSLAPRLGLDLIAEGLEDRAALKQLQEIGIVLYQGFVFGKPEPVDVWLPDPAAWNSGKSIDLRDQAEQQRV